MTGITPKYELKIIIDPPVAGKVDGAGKYAEGREVQVHVSAFDGWKFIGWIGDLSHSKQIFSVVMEKDITATATFKRVFKPSAALITLSLISFFLLSAIVYTYNAEKKSLIQNIVSLERDKEELEKQNQSLTEEKEKLEGDKKTLEREKSELTQKIITNNEKIKALENSSIDYKIYSGELTSVNPHDDYEIYIKASQSFDAYLFDMAADADLEILNANKQIIARSMNNGSVPDVVNNFPVSSSGTYSSPKWVVWCAPPGAHHTKGFSLRDPYN